MHVAHPTDSHQDLMPILYVARIMVGTFSTDVWHVNNMTLGFGMAMYGWYGSRVGHGWLL